jgi:hypothetical protein
MYLKCKQSSKAASLAICSKSEASCSTSVFVHHKSSIESSTKLHEAFLGVCLCGVLTDASDKNSARADDRFRLLLEIF